MHTQPESSCTEFFQALPCHLRSVHAYVYKCNVGAKYAYEMCCLFSAHKQCLNG